MEYRRINGKLIKKTKEEWDAIDEANKPEPTYAELRNAERGSVEEQLEYIQENGLQAWIDRDNTIRAKYPKGQEDGA